MKHTQAILGLALLGCMGVSTTFIFGCGGSSANRSSGGSSDGYTGSFTVQNGTGQAICQLEVLMNDGYVSSDERIEVDATAQVELSSPTEYIYATGCDGSGFVYQASILVPGDSYTLGSGNEQTFQGRYEYLLQLNRMSINEPAQDSSLISQFQQAVEAKARDASWSDEPTILRVASEWGIMRNRLTSVPTGRRIAALVGHRFPDGHCSIQIHTFAQVHDGNDFSGTIGYEGSAGNITTGCTMLDAFEGGASSGGGSASAPSGGSGCSNTCSSSGDGECDDGGPGAEYSVCALGTDCDDCGAR